MVFERRNYVLLLVAIALIALGYVLMAMENEIDGFVSLYISPLLLGLGYFGVIYAILWQPARTEVAHSVPAQS